MNKNILLTLAVGITILSYSVGDVVARGGRGGGGGFHGGGGGMRGGAGGSRPAMNRTPSVNRPAPRSAQRPTQRPQTSRPYGGGNIGGGSSSRPNISRPNLGSGTANRPNLGNRPAPGNRPNLGNLPPAFGSTGQRPNQGGNRPQLGGATGRPNLGGRPTKGDLNNFLDLRGGSRPSNASRPAAGGRPSTLPGRQPGSRGPAGGAANDFFNNRPSNRPTTLPALPGAGTLPGRPGGGSGTVGTRPGRPGGGEGTNRPGRPGGGEGDRPGRPGNRPGRPGDVNRPGRPGRPGGDWWSQNHRPDRIPDRNQWNSWRHNHYTNINANIHNHWGSYRGWYNNAWWGRYPGRFVYAPGFNYWGVATWGALSSWMPWGWSQPQYYNYGDNVYYQGDTVYYNNQPLCSADEYANQAEQIATNVPDVQPAEADWMPLGVFALTNDGENADEDPTMFIQLTVSKEGIIAGTFQNTATDAVQNLEGMVDKESQRAAWTIVDQTRPLMETGISNLTQDTAPALIHFEDGTTQQWLMVRIDKPDSK